MAWWTPDVIDSNTKSFCFCEQNLAGQLLKRQLDGLVGEEYSKIKVANTQQYSSTSTTTTTGVESISEPKSVITGETKAGLKPLYGLPAKNESKPPEPTHRRCEGNLPLKTRRSSSNQPSEQEQLGKSTEPSLEQAAKVESHVQKFIEKYLEPMLSAGVISEAVFTEVVNKTTKKVMTRHKKRRTADFLLDEGDKIKTLVKEYVRHIRCRIGDVQS